MMKFFKSLPENPSFKDPKIFGLMLVFAVYFSLRLYHLGFHDLWYDEAGTVIAARTPWESWNAPLHYILIHFWTKLCGFSEFSLRFPSMIFSFLSVLLTYLLGKALFNKKTGIIASFFIGLSPFHLWYAQEARDYSMVLCLGTASSYWLLKALKSGKSMEWLVFVLVSALGFYTSYFYIFLFFGQSVCILLMKRSKLSFQEIVGLLTPALLFSLYLPQFLDKFRVIWQGFWVLEPTGRSLLITFENFILGYNGTPALYAISNILAVVLFARALWALRSKESRKPFLFCAYLLFVPVFAAFFFSRILFSVYLDRGLILFSPYGYLLLALGAASLRRVPGFLLTGIFVLILLIGDYRFVKDLMDLPFAHHMGTYIKRPIKPAIRFLRDHVQMNEDIVAFTNQSAQLNFKLYEKAYLTYYFFDPELPDTTWKQFEKESKSQIAAPNIGRLEFKRLWVVVSDWARSGDLDENSRSVKAWLDQHFKLEFSKEIDGLWVLRYVRDVS